MSSKRSTVFDVGLNDANYVIVHTVRGKEFWRCPFYKIWYELIRRCYSKVFHNKNPTYSDCKVCDEWLKFSNFKSWMETQDWEGKELDKDLLANQNKIYSPETCLFIDKNLNIFIKTSSLIQRGNYPLGVHYKNKSDDMKNELQKPFHSRIGTGGRGRLFLGAFDNPVSAHRAWQVMKIKLLEEFIVNTKCERTCEGLSRLILKIKKDIENDTETTYLT